MGTDKDTEKLIRAARKQWGSDSVSITKGNHLKFVPPHKDQPIIIGSLTGTVTSRRKLHSQLRKAGLAA
jgi:hypothetical protein